MTNVELIKEINRLKAEKNAIILVHNYQRGEVQQIADYLGDSLGLSQQAAESDADVIVFCGVRFMAESAAILAPDKTVLLPEPDAGCPLADTISVEELRKLKAEYPEAVVVCYVNTTAEVKAESDICCTSANATKVVDSLNGSKKAILIPDYNLGHYISTKTSRECILWPGNCPTHHRLTIEELIKAKHDYPQAVVLSHPECGADILALTDEILGTGGMVKFVAQSSSKQFIIVTEQDMATRLERENPDKEFIIPSRKLICPNMKLTTLESVYEALLYNQYKVTVDQPIRDKAYQALARMLAVTN